MKRSTITSKIQYTKNKGKGMCWRGGGGGEEKEEEETERAIKTGRQTDIQTDRQTDRQKDR